MSLYNNTAKQWNEEPKMRSKLMQTQLDFVINLFLIFPLNVSFKKFTLPQRFGVVNEKVLEYTIEDRVWVRDPNTRKDVPTRRKREYEVKYNSNSYEAWCICKLMESSGIICRHIIAVFEKNDVEEVHDMFILRRWCKD
ncbi:Protein FAR1-RELATED SEQUENCE 9, partial [Bienertia sinuspersici]